MRRKPVIALVMSTVALGSGLLLVTSNDGYETQVVLSSATNLVPGTPVKVDGFDAGKVTDLRVEDGKAIATISVDDDFAPLHDGSTAQISWKAVLGERVLDVTPGPDTNQALPSGSLIQGRSDRVEVDQVLAMLDEPTRAQLRGLLDRLDSTLSGNEDQLRASLAEAGPALEALGEVLRAVGQDGPAIRKLVERLADMAGIVAERQGSVREAVSGFRSGVDAVAAEQETLQTALSELPETLDQATTTLDAVPPTVDAARPLLKDLAPAAARLPGVARQLDPVLRDLRPLVADLRPTLQAAAPLLRNTPALFDATHQTIPQLQELVTWSQPALDFLRPYTPELAGWLSNWGAAAGNYDANGHYLRAFIQQGASSVNMNPGIMPPGITDQHQRLPGQNEGQPWTDAAGSSLR